MGDLIAVTGAYGYIGKYIAGRLLSQGKQVITLTNKQLGFNSSSDQIKKYPLDFTHPGALTAALSGVDTLYNTYWVRFNYGQMSFERAVANTQTLLQSAKNAGVRRIVHLSVTNPTVDSALPYYRGKALLELYIQQSGLSYAIIRPSVVFGFEDILMNNIAFLLRHSPVFAIPGSGQYRLQPIYVEDLANIALQAGASEQNQVIDAVGPDIFSFDALVHLISEAIDSNSWIIHLPPGLALFLSQVIGFLVKDIVLTKDELRGLMAELLISNQPPLGNTSIRVWLAASAKVFGVKYASELHRHFSTK